MFLHGVLVKTIRNVFQFLLLQTTNEAAYLHVSQAREGGIKEGGRRVGKRMEGGGKEGEGEMEREREEEGGRKEEES